MRNFDAGWRGWRVAWLLGVAGLVACGEDGLSDSAAWTLALPPDYATGVAVAADGTAFSGQYNSGVALVISGEKSPDGNPIRGVQTSEVTGRLLALDRRGKAKLDLALPDRVATPILAPGGDVLVVTGPWLYRFTPAGKVRWQTELEPGVAPVAVDPQGGVYLAHNDQLSLVDADGALVWQRQMPAQHAGPGVLAGDGVLYLSLGGPKNEPLLHAFDLRGVSRGALSTETTGHVAGMAADADGSLVVSGRAGGTDSRLVRFAPGGGAVLWQRQIDQAGAPVLAADGRILVSGGGGVSAFDAQGQPLWHHASGKGVTGIALGDDGRVYFAEDTSPDDLTSGKQWLTLLEGNGKVYHRFRVDMNVFSGPPGLTRDGLAVLGGMWSNGQPPFAPAIAGFEVPARGLANAPWPRAGSDRGNTNLGRVVTRLPDAGQLPGLWLRTAGGEHRVLEIAESKPGVDDLQGLSPVYVLWRYPVGDDPVAVERGGLALTGDQLRLTPTWTQDGAVPGPQDLKLAAGTAWQLQLADPSAPGAPVAWQRVGRKPPADTPYGPPVGHLRWLMADGGNGNETVTAHAVAPDGSQIVAGRYQFSSELDGKAPPDPPLPVGGQPFYGTFVGRLDPTGKWQWLRYRVGTEQKPEAPIVTAAVLAPPSANQDGSAWLLVHGGVGIDTPAWLERWSAQGDKVAEVPLGAIGHEGRLVRLLVDPGSGDLLVAGQAGAGGLVLDSGTIPVGPGAETAGVLARLEPDGQVVWSRVFDDDVRLRIEDLALAQGGVVVCGVRSDKGLSSRSGVVNDRVFVARVDGQGGLVWQRSFDNGGKAQVQACAIDAAPGGDVVLGGMFTGRVDLGTGLYDAPDGDADGFLARLDGQGEPLWSEHLGGPGGQGVTDVRVDGWGNIAIGGSFGSALSIGGLYLARKNTHFFVAQVDPCGRLAWAEGAHLTHAGGVGPFGLGLAQDGDVVLVGNHTIHATVQGVHLPWNEPPPGNPYIQDLFAMRFQGAADARDKFLKAKGKSGACSAAAVGAFELEVASEGNGKGRVVSKPAGVDCPTACKAKFAAGAVVSLTAEPTDGGEFTGWSGACQGKGPCQVTMTEARAVSARFDRPGVRFVAVAQGPSESLAVVAARNGSDDRIAWLVAAHGPQIDLGAGPLALPGGDDLVLQVRAADGKPLFQRVLGGTGSETEGDVAFDVAGFAYVALRTGSPSLDAGTGKLVQQGPSDVVVARYGKVDFDGSGNLMLEPAWSWRKPLFDEALHRVVAQDQGGIAVGRHAGAVRLVRFDDYGQIGWQKDLPGATFVDACPAALLVHQAGQDIVHLLDWQGPSGAQIAVPATAPGASVAAVAADASLGLWVFGQPQTAIELQGQALTGPYVGPIGAAWLAPAGLDLGPAGPAPRRLAVVQEAVVATGAVHKWTWSDDVPPLVTYDWAQPLPLAAGGERVLQAVAIDAEGRSAVAGRLQGALDLPGAPASTAAGVWSAFLVGLGR